MVCGISIFRNRKCGKDHNGRPYGTSSGSAIIIKKMLWIPGYYGLFILIIFILYTGPVSSELEYYPGLRLPPRNWAQSDDFLSQLFEENARRRLQKQLAQQHFYHQMHHQRGPNVDVEDFMEPSFTYEFPENLGQSDGDKIPFAVNPADHRYYETTTNNIDISKPIDSDDNSKENQFKSNSIIDSVIEPKDDVPYYKLKSPMNVNPQIPSAFSGHSDLSALMEKLQFEEQANNNGHKNDVIKKHMEIDGAMGMYVVALIAGISAAITVGLIALGIGWYTLHKKTKAAADVDYPAYGVTGPNKDISPSGDRRLAQSAQMYHYQHQKQQIIAMENRTAGEHHGPMSDVESDDDNEEGDYTVYECPGLAPTGEMEVKNPLFLDDTPVTPSTNVIEQQPSLQQALPPPPQPQPLQQPPSSHQIQSPQKQIVKKQTKGSPSPSQSQSQSSSPPKKDSNSKKGKSEK